MTSQGTPVDLEAKSRELLDALEDRARKLGLYMEQSGVVPPPDFDGEGTPEYLIVAADFMIGDVAWSARVQDPEQHAIDKDFKGLQDDLEHSSFDEMRERLEQQKRRLEGGGEG